MVEGTKPFGVPELLARLRAAVRRGAVVVPDGTPVVETASWSSSTRSCARCGAVLRHQGHYLRVYLAHLRPKLEPDPAHPRHLVTEAGRGHRFEP